eukprot:s119_g55.t1
MRLEPMGTSAQETCQAAAEIQSYADSLEWWIWVVLLITVVLWIAGMVIVVRGWRTLSSRLEHCWNQVAGLDSYAANIEDRVDTLARDPPRTIQGLSDELSMVEDYQEGLHYAIVEQGWYVRNTYGLRLDEAS